MLVTCLKNSKSVFEGLLILTTCIPNEYKSSAVDYTVHICHFCSYVMSTVLPVHLGAPIVSRGSSGNLAFLQF